MTAILSTTQNIVIWSPAAIVLASVKTKLNVETGVPHIHRDASENALKLKLTKYEEPLKVPFIPVFPAALNRKRILSGFTIFVRQRTSSLTNKESELYRARLYTEFPSASNLREILDDHL